MRRAAEVMEARREEIISWLVRESGSTRLKATLEYELTHAIMLWAATVHDQVEGECWRPTFPAERERMPQAGRGRGRGIRSNPTSDDCP